MARYFPGDEGSSAGSTSYVSVAPGLTFNDKVQWLSVFRLSTKAKPNTFRGMFGVLGEGIGHIAETSYDSTGGIVLRFLKTGSVTLASTIILEKGVWTAVMCESGTGLPARFRVLNLETGALSTQSVASVASMSAPVSTSVMMTGNYYAGLNAIYTFAGDIFSVALCNSSALNNGEFRHWAYTQQPPRGVKVAWVFDGVSSTETDLSGNAANGVVVGTALSTRNPPMALRYGSDEPPVRYYVAPDLGGGGAGGVAAMHQVAPLGQVLGW